MNYLKRTFHKTRRFLAKKWIGLHPGLVMIAVTGSFGKTNTATAIKAVLAHKFKTIQTDINLDTNFNVPITALKVTNHKYAVFELGVDHVGEMKRYLEIVKPAIAVLTGIAPVHADKELLGSLEGIMKEKGDLLRTLSKNDLAIVNYDDTNTRQMAEWTEANVWFYGKDKETCQVWFEKEAVTQLGTTLVLHYRWESVAIKLQLIGKFHAYTAAAAACVGVSQGMSLLDIAKALGSLQPLPGRMSLEKGPLGTLLLNDARRANPASTIAGLEVLKDFDAKRKIAILGQNSELGDYAQQGHRLIGKKVIEVAPDYVVTVGPLTKYIVEEAITKLPKDHVIYTEDVFEAAKVLKTILQKDDLIYLKGSLLKHLERIPLLLEGKEVDSDEIASHRYEIYS